MHRNNTRTINEKTDRSIITDENGRRFELIPRGTLEETHDISSTMPELDIERIVTLIEAKDDPKHTAKQAARNYSYRFGAGANGKIGLAREIFSDGTYGEYFAVKKIQSSDELNLKHSANSISADEAEDLSRPSITTPEIQQSSLPINFAMKRLSKLSLLSRSAEALTASPPRSPRLSDAKSKSAAYARPSLSMPGSPRHIGDAKRQELLDNIKRESYVNTLLTGINGICTTDSQTQSTKKRDPNTKQLYQFMRLACLGDLDNIAGLQRKVFFSLEEMTNFKIYLTHQMIRVIAQLHANTTVSHRDLKGGNFVVDKNAKVLLIDFGCASYQDKDNKWFQVSSKTDGNFQPPAFLKSARTSVNGFDRIHDEWALAKTILELWHVNTDALVNDPKLSIEARTTQHIAYINSLRHPNSAAAHIPTYLIDFIVNALEIDPAKRKINISAMYNEAEWTADPDISKALGKIHLATARRNQMFFTITTPIQYQMTRTAEPEEDHQTGSYIDDDELEAPAFTRF